MGSVRKYSGESHQKPEPGELQLEWEEEDGSKHVIDTESQTSGC